MCGCSPNQTANKNLGDIEISKIILFKHPIFRLFQALCLIFSSYRVPESNSINQDFFFVSKKVIYVEVKNVIGTSWVTHGILKLI